MRFTFEPTKTEIDALKTIVTRLQSENNTDLSSFFSTISRKLSSSRFTGKLDVLDSERILLEILVIGELQNISAADPQRADLENISKKLKKGRRSK